MYFIILSLQFQYYCRTWTCSRTQEVQAREAVVWLRLITLQYFEGLGIQGNSDCSEHIVSDQNIIESIAIIESKESEHSINESIDR